jgi:hypothetical protein
MNDHSFENEIRKYLLLPDANNLLQRLEVKLLAAQPVLKQRPNSTSLCRGMGLRYGHPLFVGVMVIAIGPRRCWRKYKPFSVCAGRR